jgi:competence ComEA-like helix-hairpin-helix protein
VRSFVGNLSPDEMKEVDNQLEVFLDLGYEDESKEQELIRLRAEVTQYKAKIEYLNESIIARGKEIANMNAKYNKAVDRIVDLELDLDVAQRIAARKAEPVVEVEESTVEAEVPPVVEEQEKVDEPKKEFVREVVNVNTASAKEISEKLGVSMRVAYDITGYRKNNGLFVDVEELLDVPKVTKPMFERIKDHIVIEAESAPEETEEPESEEVEEPKVAAEKEIEKVNVNQANIYELMAVGFSKEVAARIIHSRRTCGPVSSIDELTRTDGVRSKDIRKLGDKLEV